MISDPKEATIPTQDRCEQTLILYLLIDYSEN